MGIAELHVHSLYSFDGTATVSAVYQHAKQIGLDVIAMTDKEKEWNTVQFLSVGQRLIPQAS